ncbi:MAG TPA: ComF family protein [Candidatus Acidoferrum sp.]|nr:ComF family protein [Candidatus Acidoferrum sp.]
MLLPAPCRICGAMLANAGRIPICEACFALIAPIAEPMCQCCGRPFEVAPQAHSSPGLCRLCRTHFYAFDRARSFAHYNDALAGAIVLLKYEEVTRLGSWFAERLANLVRSAGDDFRADVVVPVPLHPDRRRERGYNQAELIARPLAKNLGLDLGAYLLVRTKPRPAQLVLSRSEHWKSVRGAYATRPGVRVDKLRILLVDDVLTTGATLDACSRELKRAGAASIMGLTVARVVLGSSFTASKQGTKTQVPRNQQGSASIS